MELLNDERLFQEENIFLQQACRELMTPLDDLLKFELADGGALLLDEIGEMSPQLQAKLLHVLQDGEFSRLGGKRELRVDTRIIACTNRKLEEAVSQGQFREDLYFRLNVIRIKVPPLRDRKQEILFLSNYFIEKYSEKYGSPIQELPRDILQTFLQHDWPGNVRQLENVVKRFLILPDSDITAELRTANAEAAPPVAAGNISLKEVAGHAAEVAEKTTRATERQSSWPCAR